MKTNKFSKEQIIELIKDLVVNPRLALNKWCKITNQTAQVRIAYPGQHLASVVTGLEGGGTAARGDDLTDGSEVKTCSRADQLGTCKDCDTKVMRVIDICPKCGSKNIKVMEDSHWIFSIKDEEDLKLLLSVPRILLILFDRDERDYLQIRIWHIDPSVKYVKDFFGDYFKNNFMVKFKSRERKIAPANLHPLKYDFYLMKPALIFRAKVEKDDVKILFYDLDNRVPEKMPSTLLREDEIRRFLKNISLRNIMEHLERLGAEGRKVLGHKKLTKKSVSLLTKQQFNSLFPFIEGNFIDCLVMREKVIKKNVKKHVRMSMRKV